MSIPNRPAVPTDDARVEDLLDSAWQRDDSPKQFYEMLGESPAAVEAFNRLAEEISARQHTLAQVRRARELTQKVIGTNLNMDQSAVSHPRAPERHSYVHTPIIHPGSRRRPPPHSYLSRLTTGITANRPHATRGHHGRLGPIRHASRGHHGRLGPIRHASRGHHGRLGPIRHASRFNSKNKT